MSDSSNSATGVAALVILALSFLTPGWVAGAVGLAGPHAHLLDWIATQKGLFCLILWLAYGPAGFCVLLAAAVAVGGAGLAALRGLRNAKAWALRTSVTIAWLLASAMVWLAQILGEWLWDIYATQLVRVAEWGYEQRELRRLYREEYAAAFPSFRAFLRFYRKIADGDDPDASGKRTNQAATDPVEAAIRLMGLSEGFGKDDLKRRFRTLIARIHPDKVGPNELATLLVDAYALIKERRGWT
jgi:hypothetical protein